jgi:hypothetical protein
MALFDIEKAAAECLQEQKNFPSFVGAAIKGRCFAVLFVSI